MGELIQVGDKIRVEEGQARKNAVATKELLEDANTAKHYQEGQLDALGKRIVLGQPMTYLDYRGTKVWYVYELQDVGVNEIGEIIFPESPHILRPAALKGSSNPVSTQERWIPVAVEGTKEMALAAAEAMKE